MEKTAKFLDKSISFAATASIDREVEELKECLKSEGVDLSIGDILKAYDIYLRIVGLGRDAITGTEESLKGIFTLFGPVTVGDFTEKIKAGEVALEPYEELYDEINIIMEHEDNCSKFDDYKSVRSGLMVLFKEFAIFTNEILEQLWNQYDSVDEMETYTMEMHYHDNSKTKFISFTIYTESDTKLVVESIISCAVCESMPSVISVIADTFPKEAIEKFNMTCGELISNVEDPKDGNK